MSAPISARQMLRQLLVAALEDVPTPTCIDLQPHSGTPTLQLAVGTEDAAHRWARVLRLKDIHDGGQPRPLTAVEPKCWSGILSGLRSGWMVLFTYEVPYTAEHEALWVAKGGPVSHPRVPALVGAERTDADR